MRPLILPDPALKQLLKASRAILTSMQLRDLLEPERANKPLTSYLARALEPFQEER